MNITEPDSLPPEVRGWIRYRCSFGETAAIIGRELLLDLEWLRHCKAIKKKYPNLSDDVLLRIKHSFMNGTIEAEDLLQEVERIVNPPKPKPPTN